MGARIVVAVKPGSARKAGEVLDPNADPDSDFGRNICYDYVVYERPEDLIKIPQSVQRAKGVRCVDWNWVTDCLIARKLFEQPEED